jgi:undecaprenyl-diphosphatase
MKLNNWLWLEKEDLSARIHHYSKFRLILLFSAVIGFFVSIIWVWQATKITSQLHSIDSVVIQFISGFKQPEVIQLFSLITYLGSVPFIIGFFFILSIILIIHQKKRAAAASLISLSGTLFFVFLLKNTFGRQRPFGCFEGIDCYSFPSGHASISFYFYSLVDYLILRFFPLKTKYFLVISISLGLLIFLIAVSRVALSYHYPSDIIGGFFLGSAWLSLTIIFIDILY